MPWEIIIDNTQPKNKRWVLLLRGKPFSYHSSYKKARAQERAVEIKKNSKIQKGGDIVKDLYAKYQNNLRSRGMLKAEDERAKKS